MLFFNQEPSKNINFCKISHYYLHTSYARWYCRVTGQISSLQATQMTQEAAIRDLDNERNRLKDKVLRMEEERESLQSQCQALDERQKQQLLSLEKVCRVTFTYNWNNTPVSNLWASS